MNIALWIVQGLLALVFLGAGFMKATRPREELLKTMGWVNDFSQSQVRLIGIAEILGALGLVLPGLLGIYPLLSPWAAAGLALLMAGAAYTHLRRSEPPLPIVLLLLAAFVAYGRLALLPL